MDARGLNPHALGAKSGNPSLQSTVHRYLERKVNEPRRATLQPLADFLQVDVAAFFDADKARAELARLGLQAGPHEESNVSEGPAIRGLVPLISWVRAGNWCEASDPLQPGDAEEWLPCPAAHSQGTFALRVRGDSMTAPHGNSRTYPEGCIIFVDPERKNPVNGDRIVACLEGSHEVTFKIYKNEDGRQWLQPLNPSHEPIREAFHVLGTVIGKWEPE